MPELLIRSVRTFYAGVLISLDYKRMPDDADQETKRQVCAEIAKKKEMLHVGG
jgi:hypothetical protein